VILAYGFNVNESNKCVYTKFDGKGNDVIICLDLDDMLIFGIDLYQVQLTKRILSSEFDMKDMAQGNVILGIRIVRDDESSTLTQSHYIEKVLKKIQSY